jgi:hypothetical protein
MASKCGKRLSEDECIAAWSAANEATRPRIVSCITESCGVRCFDAYDLRPSTPVTKPTAKAPPPPSRAADLAKWPNRAAPIPADWTACKLSTDCETVFMGGCGYVQVTHKWASVVAERVRIETKGKPDPRDAVRSCAGPMGPVCKAGRCEAR